MADEVENIQEVESDGENESQQNAGLLKRLSKVSQARKEAEALLIETNKKLEDLAKTVTTLQSERDAERLNALRLKTATEKGLPASMAERLVGSTPEEIAADADALLVVFKEAGKPQTPGVPPTPKGESNPVNDLSKMSVDEVIAWSSKQGL